MNTSSCRQHRQAHQAVTHTMELHQIRNKSVSERCRMHRGCVRQSGCSLDGDPSSEGHAHDRRRPLRCLGQSGFSLVATTDHNSPAYSQGAGKQNLRHIENRARSSFLRFHCIGSPEAPDSQPRCWLCGTSAGCVVAIAIRIIRNIPPDLRVRSNVTRCMWILSAGSEISLFTAPHAHISRT